MGGKKKRPPIMRLIVQRADIWNGVHNNRHTKSRAELSGAERSRDPPCQHVRAEEPPPTTHY